MTNLNDIKTLKQSNASKLSDAITNHIETIKQSNEWADLLTQCQKFENDGYDKQNEFIFDDLGMLNSRIQVSIPQDWHNDDMDVLEAISEALHDEFNCLYFAVDKDTDSTLNVEQCLGETTTIRDTASRGEYYIHSSELGLKLQKNDVRNEEHALYLIECAMRKAGYFGNIVEIDYYGYFIKFVDTGLGRMTPEELDTYGKQFDESEAS